MANSYTNLLYHLVFSTKNRHPWIIPEIRDPLYQYFGGLILRQRGTLLAAGGMPDHVHLVARLPPRHSLSSLMRFIKSDSSRWLKEQLEDGVFAWQTGYGAFSVSPSQMDGLLRYVANQERHHRDRSYQAELRALLSKNGIAYEERYLWD